jgi:GntR family transcriptional regulator/MocR family aminotransferase
MARWELTIEVDRRSAIPLYQQIARAIADDVRRGRLRAGDALPGTRTLAKSLGVQRLTVVSAFDDLAAEGWITAIRSKGTIISAELPEPAAPTRRPRSGVPSRPLFPILPAPADEMPYDIPPGGLLFAPNRPDVRLIPADLIGRAYRRAIRHAGKVLLAYGRPQGHERLRIAIATMVSATRGIAATADHVCIVRGSQMGLALLARSLVKPNDVVGVEELSYSQGVAVFRAQGATIAPIPLDAEGLRIEPLRTLAESGRLRAVYVTPHHQFPTTVTLSAGRRMQLLDLARQYRFAIIEEDYDHEFHYDGAPVLPLASSDRWGVVAYVGSFSKVLAPAMRIGYVVAPRALVKSVAAQRLYIDVQGDRVLEYAVAELLEEGQIQRYIRRIKRIYAERRNVLADALRRKLGEALTFSMPAGGIALWAKAADDIDIDRWAGRARSQGAMMITARHFAVDGKPRPYARLGFASLNEQELVEAVRRLAAARRRLA